MLAVQTERRPNDLHAGSIELEVPVDAPALVLFTDGAADGFGARATTLLRGHGLATLLLRPPDVSIDAHSRVGVERLARQVERALDWAAAQRQTAALPLGLFGANCGAAVALAAAAQRPGRVRAIVVSGGEPDLAEPWLGRIDAPTLLVVGAADDAALQRHRVAMRRLRCTRRLEAVPGASQCFSEPGALESIVELAADWYGLHLARRHYP